VLCLLCSKPLVQGASSTSHKKVDILLVHFVVFLAYRTEEQNAELFEVALKRGLGARAVAKRLSPAQTAS